MGMIFKLFGSSHFRDFLLLRHFALMLVTPNTEAISTVAIKRIAQKGVEKTTILRAVSAWIRFTKAVDCCGNYLWMTSLHSWKWQAIFMASSKRHASSSVLLPFLQVLRFLSQQQFPFWVSKLLFLERTLTTATLRLR